MDFSQLECKQFYRQLSIKELKQSFKLPFAYVGSLAACWPMRGRELQQVQCPGNGGQVSEVESSATARVLIVEQFHYVRRPKERSPPPPQGQGRVKVIKTTSNAFFG